MLTFNLIYHAVVFDSILQVWDCQNQPCLTFMLPPGDWSWFIVSIRNKTTEKKNLYITEVISLLLDNLCLTLTYHAKIHPCLQKMQLLETFSFILYFPTVHHNQPCLSFKLSSMLLPGDWSWFIVSIRNKTTEKKTFISLKSSVYC